MDQLNLQTYTSKVHLESTKSSINMIFCATTLTPSFSFIVFTTLSFPFADVVIIGTLGSDSKIKTQKAG